MTMLACEQPGCSGAIEDGYCDSCGLAPSSGNGAAPATEIGNATPCAQLGCNGTIEDDGYCDTCGMAPALGTASVAVSASVTTGSSGASTASSAVSRSSSTVTGRRGTLGAGLLEIPPVLTGDPAAAVLADPQVPEGQRVCGSCGEPVGRGSDGAPGRVEGFCRTCGTRFDFRPRLQQGDLVAGQYEVLGCLAHGGLGWIYLARDRNVSDRWVVP
jgi:serine/threonine-protein kinase PknG